MKKLIIVAVIAGLAAPFAASAKPNAAGFEVVERGPKGKPTKVKQGDKIYDVCTSDNSDGCINPREAGLGYGNNTAKTWPGKPISRSN